MLQIKQWYRQRSSSSSFLSHVLAVSGSTTLIQIIGVLSAPINSRLYSPTDYGQIAVFGASFAVLTLVATMRYDGALPVAESSRDAVHLLLLCLLLNATFASLFALAILVVGANFSQWLFGNNSMQAYLWFLPLGLFLNGMFAILSSWAVRKQAFGPLSSVRLAQAIVGTGVTITLGMLHFGFAGLVAGSLASYALGLPKLSAIALAEIRREWRCISWDGLQQSMRTFYRFPLFNLPSLLLNNLGSQLPILMISSTFGPLYTGYFSVCQRLLLLPTLLISGAITPVFYSRARQAHLNGNLQTLAGNLVKGIVGINVPFIILIALFGEQIFTLALGEQWSRAGLYGSLLAPWLLFNFLVTPLATLPLVLDRQRSELFFQFILAGCRIGALWLGSQLRSDLVAIGVFGAVSAILMIMYLIWLLRLARVSIISVFNKLALEIAISAILIGGCRIIWFYSEQNLIITGGALVVFGVLLAIRILIQFKHMRQLNIPEAI